LASASRLVGKIVYCGGGSGVVVVEVEVDDKDPEFVVEDLRVVDLVLVKWGGDELS